jgi:hypothetical protein
MADTNLNDFIINKLTQAQYDAAEKDPNQLYIVTDADKYQEKLTAGHNITINKNVISATDELPDQTGNMGKVLTTNGENVYWANFKTFNIFDYKWTDHILNDTRWLQADPFSWHTSTGYKDAYNHLVADGTTQSVQFTLDSSGVFKILAGSVICIPDGYEEDGLTRKYISVTINTDTIITAHSGTDNWTGYLWYNPATREFGIGSSAVVDKANIPTTGGCAYWDAERNVMERYLDGVFQYNQSFPLAFMESSSVKITKIVEIYNGVNGLTKSTYTQNDITITYFTAVDDKHTICLPDQETNLNNLFQTTGKAWFYILDTVNKRFKLPRNTNTADSINNYLYFYVNDYAEEALYQISGITAEQLNAKVDKDAISQPGFNGQIGTVSNMNSLPLGTSLVTVIKDFTTNPPTNENLDWQVTTTEYNNLRIQSAIKLSDPRVQLLRTRSGGVWSSWTYQFAIWQ